MDRANKILTEKGLKATTQRLVILKKISEMKNHPCAEDVHNAIKKEYPSISLSTVYNTLELFVENGIINTLKSDKGVMRYDPINTPHHHLYCEESKRIEDYHNEELDELIKAFFEKNKISNFKIDEINLQLKGKFKKIGAY